jgi:oligopeptide transport system substrate-binding protein
MRDADGNPEAPFRLWAYQQAEQILVTDVAWIPLDQQTVWWETDPTLQGFTISSTGLIPRASWQTMYVTGR